MRQRSAEQIVTLRLQGPRGVARLTLAHPHSLEEIPAEMVKMK